MLDTFRKSQRWLTGIIIALVGIAFVFFLGVGGPMTGNQGPEAGVVLMLDDIRIDTVEYNRLRSRRETQMREYLGAQFDEKTMSGYLDSQTMRDIVSGAVLSQSAAELGIVVGTEEIKNILRQDTSLRDQDGRFDQENFDANIKWEFGSQAAFMAVMQRDLMKQKMIDLLFAQSSVSDAEAEIAARFATEQVQIAYVALDDNSIPEADQPADEDIQTYLEANREALKTQYEAEASERFAISAQVRVRHILFGVDKNADEAGKQAGRERAEKALARLKEGADFAVLAEELSDDSISNKKGGDLGFISRGDTSPNLEQAAFGLEVDAIGDVIEGPEGFHLIRVDEKIAESKQPFEEAGLVLAADGARSEIAARLAQSLSDAVAAGASLEDAARSAGHTLERGGFFKRRRDGFIPQLNRGSTDLMATAFNLGMDAPSSKRIFEIGKQLVLIQLLNREDPDEAALTEAKRTATRRLEIQRRNEILQTWVDTRQQELTDSNRLSVNAEMVAGG